MDERDAVDHHVGRWSDYWKDEPQFAPEVEGALVRMNHILSRARREDAAAFAHADLSLEDYKTLHGLMVQPFPTEATPAQLAEVTGVTRAAMTSRLDRLVKAGLVTREEEPRDRRRVMIRPTAAGRAAWNENIFAGMARDQRMLSALAPDELIALNVLLRKVVRNLDDTI